MNFQFTPRPTRLKVRFPNRIREYRLKAGLSQRHLAGQLGLRRNAVSAWERGISSPGLTHLLHLARTLGTLAAEAVPDFNFAFVPGALAPRSTNAPPKLP